LNKKFNKGFSLLEILVAMALVALIFSMVANFNFTSKQASEEIIEDLIVAIESMTDEAALKNTFVRLNIELEPMVENLEAESPPLEEQIQNIFFEYSIEKKQILEKSEKINRAELTQTQLQDYLKNQKSNQNNFARISSLKNGKIPVQYPVRILGIGYPNENKFVSSLTASIYFYPDGDKDPAIIFLTDGIRIHYLVIPPFGLNIKYEAVLIDLISNDLEFEDLIDKASNQAKQIFEKIRLETN